jgi:hypothetical protein
MEECDILQLTQEALDLANTACHFDTNENYVGAYDYYDKCILNLDEIIGKLPPTSIQWKKLMEIRSTYDDRMDQLKEMESSRSTFSSLGFNKSSSTSSTASSSSSSSSSSSATSEQPFSSSASTGQRPHHHHHKFGFRGKHKGKAPSLYEEYEFQDEWNLTGLDGLSGETEGEGASLSVDTSSPSASAAAFSSVPSHHQFIEPPTSQIEVPFWLLSNIRASIKEKGSFLTRSLYLPGKIWYQSDIKFSGFSSKSTAFDIILNLLNSTELDELYFSYDEDTLYQVDILFLDFNDQLLTLRNQLSKSFPYIKEIRSSTSTSSSSHANSNNDDNDGGSSHHNTLPTSSTHSNPGSASSSTPAAPSVVTSPPEASGTISGKVASLFLFEASLTYLSLSLSFPLFPLFSFLFFF